MATIIAARFPTSSEARKAFHDFLAKGFQASDIYLFFTPSPGQHATFPIGGDEFADPGTKNAFMGAGRGVLFGTMIGGLIGILIFSLFSVPGPLTILAFAGIGAYLGSLIGGVTSLGTHLFQKGKSIPAPRNAGMILAVRIQDKEAEQIAIQTLDERGADGIEKTHGEWREGKWVDFDPVKPPQLIK